MPCVGVGSNYLTIALHLPLRTRISCAIQRIPEGPASRRLDFALGKDRPGLPTRVPLTKLVATGPPIAMRSGGGPYACDQGGRFGFCGDHKIRGRHIGRLGNLLKIIVPQHSV